MNYEKMINKILDDDIFTPEISIKYDEIIKTFINIPGIEEIFKSSMKDALSINDDKMNLKKFYKKVRQLLIEMSKFYNCKFIIPNENIWNENDPLNCLPFRESVYKSSETGKKYPEFLEEYNTVYNISFKVRTNLQNATTGDFKYLNNLHKKYVGKND